METSIYSKQVCELLAQQLATEQAEVLKHQAIVEGIQKTIFDKKKEIIKRIVNNYFFSFEDKLYSALNLMFSESDGIYETQSFHIDDAIKPGFFEETGIKIFSRGGYRDLESFIKH